MTKKPAAKSSSAKKETTDESTKPKVGELVVQAHGGALRHGGTNKGGPGRPPSELRGSMRDILERGGLDVLEGFMRGVVPMVGKCEKCGHEHEGTEVSFKAADRLKAIEILSRYGGVDKLALTVDEQDEREWTPERAAAAWEVLQRIRTVEEFEKHMVDAAKKQLREGGE